MYRLPLRRSLLNPLVSALEFFFRDDFTTTESAPLTSPRTAEPGPGELTFVETDGTWAISGTELVFTAQSTPSWGDQGFIAKPSTGTPFTRSNGTALLAVVALTTWEEWGLGWHTAAAVVDPDSMAHAIQANATDGRLDNENATPIITGLSTSTDYKFAQVLRAVGGYTFINTGSAWDLLWIDDVLSTASMYAVCANLDGAGNMPYARVADLPEPFDEDVLHSRDAGNVAVSTVYTHPERCVIEFDYDSACTGSATQIAFRRASLDDRYYLRIPADDKPDLYEEVNNDGGTSKAAALTALVGGERLAIHIDGNNISLFIDGVHEWTYTDATNQQLTTDGNIDSIGTGAAISDLDIYELGDGVVTYEDATPEASDTFTHDADTQVQFTVDTLPSAGEIIVIVRSEDATHNWRVEVDSDGDLSLIEDDGGDTSRINAAAVLSGGEVIKAEFIGNRITLFYDGTQAGTYGTAHGDSGVLTATDGEFDSLGTGGAASNLTVTSLARHDPPGIATQSVLGFPVVGQVFEHEADFVLEFTLNGLPSAAATDSIIFRTQDATHNWRIDITEDGGGGADLALVEDDAGDTTRINAASALSGGERIVLIADGDDITLYYDGTQAGTYGTAHGSAGVATATDGSISLTNSMLISNLIVYPRTLSGSANAVLNRYSA